MERGHVFAEVWKLVYERTGNYAEANDRACNALEWFDRTTEKNGRR